MQIYGPAHVHSTQAVSGPHPTRSTSAPDAASSTSQVQDQLDLSPAAQLLDKIADLPDIRQDRVSQLRQMIADGTYETEERMSGALDRLLDEIG